MSKLIEDNPVTSSLITLVSLALFIFNAGSTSGKALDQVDRNKASIERDRNINKADHAEMRRNNKERDVIQRSIERKVDRILIIMETKEKAKKEARENERKKDGD